jgi:hypothetical protein
MSMDIDDAFVKQYESEVHEAYQRKGSKLRNTVRVKNNVRGQSTTFQKVGKGTASTKTRHGKVPLMNVDHTPVECTLTDYFAGDYVDKFDELKINHDERRVQVNAGAYALGRQTDDLIITAANGATTYQTAEADKSTLTAASFSGIVTTLGSRDVPIEPGEVFGIVTWEVWDKMLSFQQFASSDYIGENLPFRSGAMQAKMWMDVIWMPHSGLTVSSTVSTNFVYHRTAIGHAVGAEVETDITWQGDYHAHFVNNAMSQGSVLIDTEGVQQFLVDEDG